MAVSLNSVMTGGNASDTHAVSNTTSFSTTGHTIAAASDLDEDVQKVVGDSATKSERAKAVGTVIAERAKAAGISAVVFDRGGFLYHGRVKAVAEGAREGGLEF